MDFIKRLFPDFRALGSIDWAKPAVGKKNMMGTVLALLSLLMVVFVFFPWFRWEYFVTDDGVTTMNAFAKLGITSVWGILGLVVALVALCGALYKQYAITFWAAILATIFGCFGTDIITDFAFSVGKNDYVVYEESLKMLRMTDASIPVTHVGANLFMITAVVLAALSLVGLLKKDECEKPGCIAKIAFALAVVIAFVICLDAAFVTPSFLSLVAIKMLAWNLPLITILLVAFSCYKGEGKSLNIISVALLVVSFFFTNPATIVFKSALEDANKFENIATNYKNAHNEAVVTTTKEYKDLQKSVEKRAEKDLEDDKYPTNITTQEYVEY